MYWNTDALAVALRDGTLTERAKYRYVVAGTLLQFLVGRASISGVRTWGGFLVFVLSIAATVVGLRAAYRANQRGDGQAFVERYVCLAVPLSVRLVLAYILFAAVLNGIVAEMNPTGGPTSLEAAWPLMYLGCLGLYFAAVRHHITTAAGGRSAPPAPIA